MSTESCFGNLRLMPFEPGTQRIFCAPASRFSVKNFDVRRDMTSYSNLSSHRSGGRRPGHRRFEQTRRLLKHTNKNDGSRAAALVLAKNECRQADLRRRLSPPKPISAIPNSANVPGSGTGV